MQINLLLTNNIISTKLQAYRNLIETTFLSQKVRNNTEHSNQGGTLHDLTYSSSKEILNKEIDLAECS